MGEVAGCIELVKLLRAELPRTRIFVSTGTLAGRATAQYKLHGLADGVFFAPVDYVFAVRRVLRTLRPSVVAIVETEIWPNLFRETHRLGAALAVVNGRISDRGFSRYRKYVWFFRHLLPQADAILAQSDEIRERFIALGARADRVFTGGSFKYDFDAAASAPAPPIKALIGRTRPGKIWIAASTMPPARDGDIDEHGVVIRAFRELAATHRDLLLILAPRKTDTFDAAAALLAREEVVYVRRSALTDQTELPLPGVLLLDTIGELSALFSLADAVFMGGTLADRGGHNPLEPAFFGKAVIAGPHMENFRAIADEFRAAKASIEIAAADELAGAVAGLLESPQIAEETGRRALACALARRGASARGAAKIRELYRDRLPRYRPPMPWFAVAWTLSRAWLAGARRGKKLGDSKARRLEAPVISVGNLSVGGTGKTPCVLRLVELLKTAGYSPGILTRGYGRVSPERAMAVAPGATIPTSQSGDEPQIFIRARSAPVGIGADRYETGKMLMRNFTVDVLALDDGFQHVRLARDADIVLIDALNPFGGGEIFPLGRLREPIPALARADVVIISRSEFTDLPDAIERVVRRWNSDAPIFRARITPEAWIENRGGRTYPAANPPFRNAGAFCGLGNPQAFRMTLRDLGVTLADFLEFEDHHRYRPHELKRIATQFASHGADAAVTTEKDAVNLCESCDDLLSPLPLYYLRVTITIEDECKFLNEILRRIRSNGS